MKIGIPKERQPGEKRVAASPETVKKLKAAGVDLIVEKGAGEGAAIADKAFETAGAELGDAGAVWSADMVLKVQRPTDEEMGHLRKGQILIGALDPYPHREQVQAYAEKGVTAFALELLPRTTRAQAMDMLSSQANLAGYKIVVDAIAAYSRCMPMMMTAAGTVTPAKFFVVGAGVAGLQAIATAKRMGAVVTATDVRPAARQEIESLRRSSWASSPRMGRPSGGYARPLTSEEQKKQAEMVAEHLKTQDIVVTTAQIPGRKAPRIITADMVKSMKSGSVVVDLAAEIGRQCRGQRARQDGHDRKWRVTDRCAEPAVQARAGSVAALRQEPDEFRHAAGRQGQEVVRNQRGGRSRQRCLDHQGRCRRPSEPQRRLSRRP